MATPRMHPLAIIGSCDIDLDATLWDRLCADDRPRDDALAAALDRATPPAAALARLWDLAVSGELARGELVAAWRHFDTVQRVALIAAFDDAVLRSIAAHVGTVDEVDAMFASATEARTISVLLDAEQLPAAARSHAVARVVTDAVVRGITRYDDLLRDLLSGAGVAYPVTRAAARAALPAPDAHSLMWWLLAETTDEDRDRIIAAAVSAGSDDGLCDTATWAHRLGPDVFDRFCAAVTAASEHAPRPELVVARERIAELTAPREDEHLNALAVAYLANGDAAQLTAALADRSRPWRLDRALADEVITDARTGTELALLAARSSRNAGLEAPALFTLRPDDEAFHAALAAQAPGAATATALTGTGRLSDVAVRVLELWVSQNSTVHAETWVDWVDHTGDRLAEVSWPAAHAAAVHSDRARQLLGDVYRRAPILALELTDGFTGSVADFDAMLRAAQRDGHVASSHVPSSSTHSTV